MAEIDVTLDDDIADLLSRGALEKQEALNLQTLRETQRLLDEMRKKKEEPSSEVSYNIRRRK